MNYLLKFKKQIFILLVAITICSNLSAYPCAHTRFFNEQTGQTLDLISDIHLTDDFIKYAESCDKLSEILNGFSPAEVALIWEHPVRTDDGKRELERELNQSFFYSKYAFAHQYNQNFIASDLRSMDECLIILGIGTLPHFLNKLCSAIDDNEKIKEFMCLAREKHELPVYLTGEKAESTSFNYLRNLILEQNAFDIKNLPTNVQKVFSSEIQLWKAQVQQFFNKFNLNQPGLLGVGAIVSHLIKNGTINNLGGCADMGEFIDIGLNFCDFQMLKNIFTLNHHHLIVYAGVRHCANIKRILKNNALNFKIVFEGNEENIFNKKPKDILNKMMEELSSRGLSMEKLSAMKKSEAEAIINEITAKELSPPALPARHWQTLLEGPRKQIS